LTFISSPSKVRKINENGLAAFSFATEAVDTACALLDRTRVPGEIMVYHMAAESLKINSLSHNLAAD
jgi:hypothetical protein